MDLQPVPAAIARTAGVAGAPLVDMKADEPGMVTVYIGLEYVAPIIASDEVQCVAELVWGTDGTEQRVVVDVMRGMAITLACKRLRVSVRNLGTKLVKATASVGPGSRSAAREAQLTTVGASLPGGTSATYEVPAYAAWVEIWRTRERETEFEADLNFPAPAAALYTSRAQPGERMPRMPIANGVTLITLRNTGPAGAEPTSDVSVASAFAPVLIWGLWL